MNFECQTNSVYFLIIITVLFVRIKLRTEKNIQCKNQFFCMPDNLHFMPGIDGKMKEQNL